MKIHDIYFQLWSLPTILSTLHRGTHPSQSPSTVRGGPPQIARAALRRDVFVDFVHAAPSNMLVFIQFPEEYLVFSFKWNKNAGGSAANDRKGLKSANVGSDWGRGGSPRAHTQAKRSYRLQEGF